VRRLVVDGFDRWCVKSLCAAIDEGYSITDANNGGRGEEDDELDWIGFWEAGGSISSFI
jgi:hypothetical protein